MTPGVCSLQLCSRFAELQISLYKEVCYYGMQVCRAAPCYYGCRLLSPLCSCLFSKEVEDLGPVDHLALLLLSGRVHLLPPVVSRAPRPQPSALPSSVLTGRLPHVPPLPSLSVCPSHPHLETHGNTLEKAVPSFLMGLPYLFLCSHFGPKAETQFSHLSGKA